MATKAHSGQSASAQIRLPYEGTRTARDTSPILIISAIMSAVVAAASLDGAAQSGAPALYAVAALFGVTSAALIAASLIRRGA